MKRLFGLLLMLSGGFLNSITWGSTFPLWVKLLLSILWIPTIFDGANMLFNNKSIFDKDKRQ